MKKIEETVEKASQLVVQLLPLLEALARKDVSPNRRNDLRVKTGKGRIFRLARVATILSSETAHQTTKEGLK